MDSFYAPHNSNYSYLSGGDVHNYWNQDSYPAQSVPSSEWDTPAPHWQSDPNPPMQSLPYMHSYQFGGSAHTDWSQSTLDQYQTYSDQTHSFLNQQSFDQFGGAEEYNWNPSTWNPNPTYSPPAQNSHFQNSDIYGYSDTPPQSSFDQSQPSLSGTMAPHVPYTLQAEPSNGNIEEVLAQFLLTQKQAFQSLTQYLEDNALEETNGYDPSSQFETLSSNPLVVSIPVDNQGNFSESKDDRDDQPHNGIEVPEEVIHTSPSIQHHITREGGLQSTFNFQQNYPSVDPSAMTRSLCPDFLAIVDDILLSLWKNDTPKDHQEMSEANPVSSPFTMDVIRDPLLDTLETIETEEPVGQVDNQRRRIINLSALQCINEHLGNTDVPNVMSETSGDHHQSKLTMDTPNPLQSFQTFQTPPVEHNGNPILVEEAREFMQPDPAMDDCTTVYDEDLEITDHSPHSPLDAHPGELTLGMSPDLKNPSNSFIPSEDLSSPTLLTTDKDFVHFEDFNDHMLPESVQGLCQIKNVMPLQKNSDSPVLEPCLDSSSYLMDILDPEPILCAGPVPLVNETEPIYVPDMDVPKSIAITNPYQCLPCSAHSARETSSLQELVSSDLEPDIGPKSSGLLSSDPISSFNSTTHWAVYIARTGSSTYSISDPTTFNENPTPKTVSPLLFWWEDPQFFRLYIPP